MASRSVEGHDGCLSFWPGTRRVVPTPWDNQRRIADGLGVPFGLFLALVYVGFACFAVALMADVRALAVASCLVGVILLAIGARAVAAPSRPVAPGFPDLWFTANTRRLGAFYILVSVIWIAISAGIALGG
jgi:hypothetical protein